MINPEIKKEVNEPLHGYIISLKKEIKIKIKIKIHQVEGPKDSPSFKII